ncbi:hypothetical protein [Pyxidicoccus caerfyrddinensis]|uniref:hypothetical protein n=1 Tax=Pyxidicoccus caerfyrddinensis TaxID=2709663 RepID=UPI0013DCA62B|nr:hypothetical protein [Pyxidicoccus caerfyrddinensis]
MTPLDKAIARYGGDSLWRRLDCVTLRMLALGGPLPAMKGLGRTFPTPGLVRVYPKQFRAEFEGLGTFSAGRVDGQDAYRRTFEGFRKYRRWSSADAVYFFGYAITTYLSIPFLLRELSTTTVETREGFEISALFPEQIHTHSPRQKFYFDRDGLLLRHDYRADVVGAWATGAHFTSEYKTVNGLPIATRRKVYARLGGAVTPMPVLTAQLEPLDVSLTA